jgi:hypothetical protein
MRLKTFAPVVLFVFLALIFDAHAQQSDTQTASSAVWNDNSLIAVQKDGGATGFEYDQSPIRSV